jgi:hypothetical protein
MSAGASSGLDLAWCWFGAFSLRMDIVLIIAAILLAPWLGFGFRSD